MNNQAYYLFNDNEFDSLNETDFQLIYNQMVNDEGEDELFNFIQEHEESVFDESLFNEEAWNDLLGDALDTL